MNTIRVWVCFGAIGLTVLSVSACRRRAKADPPVVPPPPIESPTADASAPRGPAPANIRTGAGSSLAASASGDEAKEAVKTQGRFNRNSVWLSKLGENDPQVRAQVLAEIQKAGLSPAELQELHSQARQYGIKL